MKSYQERDAELDYSKDKFASEDFLDSLLFWVIVVVLVVAVVVIK